MYHVRYNCSHLQLQVEPVSFNTLGELRNQSGGRYGACGLCNVGHLAAEDWVYITPTGGSYHITLECGGLKRTITSVKLDELIGKGVCQRCG